MAVHSLKLFRELPATVRWLVLGTMINSFGALVAPFLTLVLVQKFALSPAKAGQVFAAFGCGTFLSVLVGGWVTDRLGHRTCMLLSLIGAGSLAAVLAAVSDVLVFVPLLFCFGFLADLYRPASTSLLAELLGSAQRATGFAAVRVAINIGGAVAVSLGGLLLDWNWRALFVLDGFTTLLFAWVVWSHIPKRDSTKSVRRAKKTFFGEIISIFSPCADKVYALQMAATFLLALSFSSYLTVLPLTVTDRAGYSNRFFGWFVAANGLFIFLFEMSIVAWLARYRRLKAAALGAVLLVLGMGATGLWLHWAWFAITMAFWTIGEIFAFPIIMSFNADWAPPERRGQYMALAQANFRVGQALCPMIFLPLYSHLPISVVWALLGLVALPSVFIFRYLDRNFDRVELLRGRGAVGGSG